MEPADARVMLLATTHMTLTDDYIAKKTAGTGDR